MIADDSRHPRNVLVCASCGELNEVADLGQPGRCKHVELKSKRRKMKAPGRPRGLRKGNKAANFDRQHNHK